MTEFIEHSYYRIRVVERIKPNATLVATGRGKKPKAWEYALLASEEPIRWCGNIRKGRGYRYANRYVVEFWENSQSISVTAAFPTEDQAVQYLRRLAEEFVT